jgi:Protein of unknown function (DUF2442)
MEANMGRLRDQGSRKSREYAMARAAAERERAAGLHATGVHFDAAKRRVVLELTSGYIFGIPVARLPEIRDASDAELAEAEVLGAGTLLHWESLDADYSVPALILSVVGTRNIARQLGRAGGKSTSEAKADAARRNGAKGGRPRLAARRK